MYNALVTRSDTVQLGLSIQTHGVLVVSERGGLESMGRWAPRRRGFSVTVLPAPKLETTTLGCAEPGRESLVRPGTPNEAGARSRSLVRRNDLLCAMNEVSARVTVKRRAVGCWTNRDCRVDMLVAFLCHAMAETANSGLSIQNFSHGCYQVLSYIMRRQRDGRIEQNQ